MTNTTIHNYFIHNQIHKQIANKHYLLTAVLGILFVALILSSANVRAAALPKANPVPGGIAIVDLGSNGEQPPIVHFNGKRVMVVARTNPHRRWLAITGLPLGARPGKHTLTVKAGGKEKQVAFTIHDKTYKSQYITLKNKRKVNPYKNDLKRIHKETKLIKAALRHWSDTPAELSHFQRPHEQPLRPAPFFQ
jgi:hypothetical protein